MMSRSVRAYCEATDELEVFILNKDLEDFPAVTG